VIQREYAVLHNSCYFFQILKATRQSYAGESGLDRRGSKLGDRWARGQMWHPNLGYDGDRCSH